MFAWSFSLLVDAEDRVKQPREWPMRATILLSPLARARRALAGALARLLAWPRRFKTQKHSTDETMRDRSTQPARQLRGRSASDELGDAAGAELAAMAKLAGNGGGPLRHRIGRIGPPNLYSVSVECECGWAVKADRLADALSAFDRHAATELPSGGN